MSDESSNQTKKATTQAWIIVHIVYPMIPFLIESIFRLGMYDFSLNSNTFNTSTLSVSTGMLCWFVNQDLLANKYNSQTSDRDGQSVIVGQAALFNVFAMSNFALFSAIVILTILEEKKIFESSMLTLCDILVFTLSIISMIIAVTVQRNVGLRAVITN